MSSGADKPVDRATEDAASPEREGLAGERFVRRWSRLKGEARKAPAPPETGQAPPGDAPVPAKILTDADMPPIESLNERSDFSAFLSAGVSEGLRRRALRKLFALPGIGERVELESEYYDLSGLEPLGNIITHDMREEMQRVAQKLKESVETVAQEHRAEQAVSEPATTLPPAQAENPADTASAAASGTAAETPKQRLRRRLPREEPEA